MLAGKTVLILGAGSSLEFGMPLGSALKNEILELLTFDDGDELTGDAQLTSALQALYPGEDKECIAAAKVVKASLPHFNSIDDFLHTHGDDARVSRMGKLAIARAISAREARSPALELWSAATFDNALQWAGACWPQVIVNIAATGVKANNARSVFQDLSIVNFNYDRCAESLLFSLIQPVFNIPAAAAADAMENLVVFRPYGGLGNLPYDGRAGTAFGAPDPDLVKMSEQIQVYTEALGERPDLLHMKRALAEATQVIFLGFGFHTQNVDLLVLDPAERGLPRNVFATAHSEPNPARDAIMLQISRALTNRPVKLGYAHEDCTNYLRDHRRSIAR